MDYTKLRQKVEQEIEEKREQENTDIYNKNMEELNIEIF